MSCPVLIVTGVGLGRAVAVGASTRVGVGTGVALGGGVGEAGTSVGDAAGSEPHAETISASASSPPNRPILMSGCHSRIICKHADTIIVRIVSGHNETFSASG